jgi:peptidoglycan/xylan/chitin deacetylase (PgdA/CDA1 family)
MKTFRNQFILLFVAVLLAGCADDTDKSNPSKSLSPKDETAKPQTVPKSFTGKKVPVLCYHAIRELTKNDSGEKKAYSVSPENFELQIKALSDNGYTTITPDELKDFYTGHRPLPQKPIMITFDDGRKEQFTIAAGILEKYHFKGVFFIMTVSLGKKLFMARDDVKALSDRGHVIGSHTWDHHMVTKYKDDDWQMQLVKPKKKLEEITQKPVTSFAYPHGVWNGIAADSLKRFGYTTAFLFGGKQDSVRPLYTFQRVNIPYSLKIGNFLGMIEKSFAD